MKQQEKSTPILRFPNFQDDWFLDTLGNYFTFKNGVNADKSAYGRGHKFINVLDIISDIPLTYDLILDSVDICDDDFKKNEVLYGDILFQRSSETREEVGQSNVYLDAQKSATFGGFVIRGRPTKEQLPAYFHYLLKTAKVRKDMTARSGGSTRYNIGQESLSDVSVNIAPTIKEQKKIASFLSNVDKKIIQLQKKKTLLENYKKGCIQKIFSQELRFKDENCNPFSDWQQRKLGDIFENIGGTSLENSVIDKGEYKFISIGNYSKDGRYIDNGQRIDAVGKAQEKILEPGNLVMVLNDKTSTGDIIGSTILVEKDKYIYNQRSERLICNRIIDPKFAWFYLNAPFFRRKVFSISQGGTQIYVNFSIVKNLVIYLPPLEEQKKIADFLSAIDTKITLVSTELTQAKTFKKGLLQQMFV